MFDKFIDLIRGFEQDEGIKWNRQCLAKATQTILRSQWRQWKFKQPGEQWKTTSTERFIEFIKAIQHIYFKNTVDSIFVEPSTRIIQVLGTGETVLTPSTGVRKLESLLGRFEEACVLQTDMSGLQASELEQIKTAFRESVRTEQRDGKSNRYMSELMNKGPGITSNIPPGTTLQMWLDAMIDRASEIESSLREGEKYNTSSRPPPHYIPVGTTSSDIGAGTTDRVRFKEGNLQALGREESYDQRDPLMENHYPTNPNQGSFFESIEIPPEAPKFKPYQPQSRYSSHPQQPPQPFQNPSPQIFRGGGGGGGGGGDPYHSNPLNHQTFLQPDQTYGNTSRYPPRNTSLNHNPGQELRTDANSQLPTSEFRVPSPQDLPRQIPHSHYQSPPITHPH